MNLLVSYPGELCMLLTCYDESFEFLGLSLLYQLFRWY